LTDPSPKMDKIGGKGKDLLPLRFLAGGEEKRDAPPLRVKGRANGEKRA